MAVQLCTGFVVGVMATLALVDPCLVLRQRCRIMRSEIRHCLSQLEAMENYFNGEEQQELRVHCRTGFLTFSGGECVGFMRYE
jgi:hypothetical protein